MVINNKINTTVPTLLKSIDLPWLPSLYVAKLVTSGAVLGW